MTSTRLLLTIALCGLAVTARAGADDDPQIQAHIIREAETLIGSVNGIDQKFVTAKSSPPAFRKLLKSGELATRRFNVNTAAISLSQTKWKPCVELTGDFTHLKVASSYLFLKPQDLRASSRAEYDKNLDMFVEKLVTAIGACADVLAKSKTP
ncbi:hypothetical protein [Hyphomicrobium sp.]|uniref:hypothetical protein n=1 Tax=Hyphomicrobium sp. TaxID=82 RepID=UPI002E331E1A|nr:hypothetical protein [Hyphomicrobium sp.]HEX2839946.1 hypothetical protein [Hyphomicrobium sp.]